MKKFKVGIQLYSIREQVEQDMDKALAQVSAMGYDCVEFAGFFGKTAQEVKALLEKHSLTAVSVHQGPRLWQEQGDKAIDYLKEIGVSYCAIPSYPVDEFLNNWDATIEKFTDYGKALSDAGIKLLYHNHDFEFNTIDGEFIFDKLYSTIPQTLLNPQIDTCWVHYAGQNPAEYVKKYQGRVEVVHLKDFVCEKLGAGPVYELIEDKSKKMDKTESGFKFKPVGEGIQDWEAILTACEAAGTECVIVEQDNWYDEDAMDCAKRSREYLKKTFGI